MAREEMMTLYDAVDLVISCIVVMALFVWIVRDIWKEGL